MTIDQFIAEKLVPMRGQFYLNDKGEIRHKKLLTLDDAEMCCPACAPCDDKSKRDNAEPFEWLGDIAPEPAMQIKFMDAADCYPRHDPALRARILKALGLDY